MHTHFAILWRHKKLSLAELTPLIQSEYEVVHGWVVILFNTSDENKLKRLGWIKKRGRLFWDLETVWEYLNEVALIEPARLALAGTNDDHVGMTLKKKYKVRRFKRTELGKSDRDIKNDGFEVHQLWDDRMWLVLWRQDISLYETIDFKKPVSGMEVGMMPSKLAHVLVNIWIGQIPTVEQNTTKDLTIWDPFVGFGTTWFIANHMWHHFIWSDINSAPLKANKKWRLTTSHAQSDLHFTVFKHDMHEELTQPFLKHVNVVVTEWRLWPVIKKNPYKLTRKYGQATAIEAFTRGVTDIVNIYTDFVQHVTTYIPGVPMVMTIPYYTFLDEDVLWERLSERFESLWVSVEQIDIYARKKQLVGRRVVVVKKR